ncbi:MAG: flagellar motor stator protein MotA [Sphingomonadales bacterium 32-64-17]|nr:MAG: flagellar motor stator protein MotA [Sphingomonadales bacterium 32-64-17]
MNAGIGIAVLLGCVFGGFILAGGSMGPVLHALPFEGLMIIGAAVGALIIGNSMHEVKAVAGSFSKVFKGPRHTKKDHIDAIALTSKLMKMLKTEGPVALESHVNDPSSSTIFAEYPAILANEPLTGLICDTLTLIVVSSGTLDVNAVEDVMDNAMKNTFHEMSEPQHNLQTTADALPALGIVAAVLGIVKTMGAINEPPEILGGMIGSALVGTFLGVFLAYGLVGPMASRLKQVIEADQQIFQAVKQVIIASLNGHPQPLVVESARSGLGHDFRPGLSELLDALRGR